MPPIVLKTATQYWVRMGVVFAIFGLIALGMIAGGRQPFMQVLGVAVLLAPTWLLALRLGWVARLDGAGATLISGKVLPWGEFDQLVDVTIARGGAYHRHNHYELRFRGGKGQVFDLMLANRDEVIRALDRISRGERPSGGPLVR